MARGRVLIVEADEWVATLVKRFLSDASYDTDTAATARQGYDRAQETAPDLVLVDVTLPDIDGFWLTRRLRAERRLATTPIVLISQQDDVQARLEGLSLGADVFLPAPFRHEEVIAQVDALMGMAQRLRAKRDSIFQESPLGGGSALSGDVAQISIATLLTMLEMERRTGVVRVRADGRLSVEIVVEEGAVVDTFLGKGRIEPLTAFREVVIWTRGKYSFEPKSEVVGHFVRKPTSHLLLEAMRMNDESRRDAFTK
ncbi:MAG TPA: response regulator [Polyangiaceae bacterium]|nr:response regulator [Polyangiaceae bacterium]